MFKLCFKGLIEVSLTYKYVCNMVVKGYLIEKEWVINFLSSV